MKILLTTLGLVLFLSAAAQAQPMLQTYNNPALAAGALEEESGIEEALLMGSSKGLSHIDATFNGFRVQLIVSEQSLPNDHAIFSQFGGICVEFIDNKYYYTIGKFTTDEAAKNFFAKILANNYPNAQIIAYANGGRK